MKGMDIPYFSDFHKLYWQLVFSSLLQKSILFYPIRKKKKNYLHPCPTFCIGELCWGRLHHVSNLNMFYFFD
jgi:hypothetical protein